ncbi:hypothetical protein FDP41_005101 [Naegleria fowleri]|uniref:Uncharacterized protein n=1 Tax=Naegleria fowleri TaxID=5763 RepID=A0A6A5BNV6_NAEFO|nr:uncharacterized protein FDP41_005101 [Naegleria fowleri]KAF0975774.1 hypothetical protein FDP41_005101 [Naegleria fowleri]
MTGGMFELWIRDQLLQISNGGKFSQHLLGKIEIREEQRVGDSVASLNPFYGQGITCICESLLILDEILRRPHNHTKSSSPWTAETCQEFQERVKNIYMPAYFLATTVDLQHEEAKGGSWWYRTIFLKYFAPDLKQLALASKIDPYVRITFNQVNHMMEGYLYNMLDRKYRSRCKNPVNHW